MSSGLVSTRCKARFFPLLAGLALLALAGCTSRGITITSDPPGAEVSINHRVVGKTPIRVGFEHYGVYRMELRLRGYQVLVKEANIAPAIYGYDPGAFVADNLIPARLDDEVYLHYALKPLPPLSADKVSLMGRAGQARWGNAVHPKTGEHYAVALSRDPPKIATNTNGPAPAAPPDNPALASGGNQTAEAEPPLAEKPKGLEIAQHIGIAPEEPEKNPQFVNPEGAKPQPEPGTLRIAKDEELIYAEPAAKDAAGDSGKKETKKAANSQ